MKKIRRIPEWHEARLRYFLDLLEWEVERLGWRVIIEDYEFETKKLYFYAKKEDKALCIEVFFRIERGRIEAGWARIVTTPINTIEDVGPFYFSARGETGSYDFGRKWVQMIRIEDVRGLLTEPRREGEVYVRFPFTSSMFYFFLSFPKTCYMDCVVRWIFERLA